MTDAWGGSWGGAWLAGSWGGDAVLPPSPTGGGRRSRLPDEFLMAQRLGLVAVDEILLLIAGAVAAGLLH